MASWQLQDPSDRRESAKYTFSFPSAESLEKLSKGNFVKLIFECESTAETAPRAERMWVLVDSRDASGTFTGRLDNDPAFLVDLQAGDIVTFAAKHVIDTDLPSEDDNVVDRYFPRCIVTRRVLYDGVKATCLYRESSDQLNDSGWRILAGDESPEYLSDSANAFYVSLGAVLNRDDRFVHLLDSPVGSEFEFDETTSSFGPPTDD